MKLNKWTLGLAALGLISLTPALLAQTPAPAPAAPAAPTTVPLMTALSATTISGYVDTSAVWNPGSGNGNPAPYAFNAGKQDGFNIDQVDLRIAKPLEDGKWSAGYTLELSYGPDAAIIDGGAYPIRQAYVSLQAPVGNGLVFQMGRFDNLLGYEVSDSYKNPNFTRSYAYTLEPTEHTGLLASYTFYPWIQAQVGVVNTVTTAGSNTRNANGQGFTTTESTKGLISLITLTAPDSWGSFKGSTLAGGVDYGPGFGAASNAAHDKNKIETYVGFTLNTPVTGLTVGASYDSINSMEGALTGAGAPVAGYAMAVDGYIGYKITDKLSINGRGEYAHGSALVGLFGLPATGPVASDVKVFALTGTVEYDLWANVITRVEVRWDHSLDGTSHFGGSTPFSGAVPGSGATKKNDIMIAANVVYKF
jgi:hypothetical protein